MSPTRRVPRLRLPAKTASLTGNVSVARALPRRELRAVGPFVFLDHLGPVRFGAGEGLFVPPHPHKGLETVTYLFEGSLLHKDSLGNHQSIVPGDVNWMTAGRGIVHSEETEPAQRARGSTAHGLQTWVALPAAGRTLAPAFAHYPAGSLPVLKLEGVDVRVLAGDWQGLVSPVKTGWPLFYLDIALADGATVDIPLASGFEAALYGVTGRIVLDESEDVAAGMLIACDGSGDSLRLAAAGRARLVVFGGQPLADKVVIWDNFVVGSVAEARQAQEDFLAGKFGQVT